jgi:hypothetical protein
MALFAFLVVSLGVCLVPVYSVRRRGYARAQDYFVSGEHTPPGVVQNSSVAYALQMATFGPRLAKWDGHAVLAITKRRISMSAKANGGYWDDYERSVRNAAARGKTSLTSVNSPGSVSTSIEPPCCLTMMS